MKHSCVVPPGRFTHIVHRPSFTAVNLREGEDILVLGRDEDGREILNLKNFPGNDVIEPAGTEIFEIANPLPFRGATFIKKDWADRNAGQPERIRLPERPPCSISAFLAKWCPEAADRAASDLPRPVKLALAACSTDPADLAMLAEMAVELIRGADGGIEGVPYGHDHEGRLLPRIKDHELYEVLVNNPALPDELKVRLVLAPGIQGTSEIVGTSGEPGSRVFEYLRRNSYIPWGHYASNMAHDSIRYSTADLSREDIKSLRHLYYQRTYVRLAAEAGMDIERKKRLSRDQLEELRLRLCERIAEGWRPEFDATVWGWNYGFDFAASGYRLHASHQQIHQQFAMVPATLEDDSGAPATPYSCGDMVAALCRDYRRKHNRSFFSDYITATRENRRLDGRTDLDASLVVHSDDNVMLFVPKAQTSQWELQIVTLVPAGNVLEADAATRDALDAALLRAQKIYQRLGARLVTSIEFSRRFSANGTDQRLLYSLLPKLPESMGAFSEAQLRFINGHYPEDFASACRMADREQETGDRRQ